MINIEYYPVLIDQHRKDLRALAAHAPEGVVLPSRRQAIGQMIVRLGAWLEGHRPEAIAEPSATLRGSAGNA